MIGLAGHQRGQAGATHPHFAGERHGNAMFLQHLGNGFIARDRPRLARRRQGDGKRILTIGRRGDLQRLEGFAVNLRLGPVFFRRNPPAVAIKPDGPQRYRWWSARASPSVSANDARGLCPSSEQWTTQVPWLMIFAILPTKAAFSRRLT